MTIDDVSDPVRDTLPTLLDPERTPDELLHGLQWLAALKALVAEAESRVEEALKGRPKREVDGVGSFLTTKPQPTPEVYDADALAEWLIDHPETGLEPVEHPRLDVDAVRRAVDQDPRLLNTIAALIPDARVVDLLLPGKPDAVAKRLAKRYATRDSGDRMVDGPMLDGGEPIPGVRVRTRSQPTVRVSLDDDAVRELCDSLMARYGLDA